MIAVMLYHADPSWLPAGFLGVEVFFVISGYLITALLLAEHERTGRVSLGHFWARRARRLLPALFVLLLGLTVYTALFRRDALGELRGDVVAGLLYSSNWYQIWVGQSYTAAGDFAPLRHLWSLAVEEQFYLVWPLVMVVLLRRPRVRLLSIARWFLVASVVIAVVLAVTFRGGPIASPAETPGAYWTIGGRSISKLDAMYLSTVTRFGGLLLGASFALIWRPGAIMRGGLRRKGHLLDVFAVGALAGLYLLAANLHLVDGEGGDPWLFRGGLFLTGVATLTVLAAVTHRRAWTGPVLGNPVLRWVGLRSYGLYLFHWPIYQIIREVAGNPLSPAQFAWAMAATVAVSEVSYRVVERPIRTGTFGRRWRRMRARAEPLPRRVVAILAAGLLLVTAGSTAALATAELEPNDVERMAEENRGATVDPGDLVDRTTTTEAPPPTTERPRRTTTTTTEPPPTTVARPTPGAAPTPSAAPVPTTTTSTTTTAPPTTPPTTPPPPPTILAFGDSVMLGAANDLDAAGIVVSAAVNRQMVDYLQTVQVMQAGGTLGDAVVVHLGTNGPIGDDTMTAFFTALADVPQVVVLTLRVDRSWIPGNNAAIRALPERFGNVEVLDWEALGGACPGDCFARDGYHLNADGSRYYASVVTDALR